MEPISQVHIESQHACRQCVHDYYRPVQCILICVVFRPLLSLGSDEMSKGYLQ